MASNEPEDSARLNPYNTIPTHKKINPLLNKIVNMLNIETITDMQKDFFLPNTSAMIPVGSSITITVKAYRPNIMERLLIAAPFCNNIKLSTGANIPDKKEFKKSINE
jgi:hypothetical protein